MKYNNFLQKLMIIKKIRNIKDFTNMDLSGLDLSSFSPIFWQNAIFKNTNLKNAKIEFSPAHLKDKHLVGVNLENVDLSNLSEDDFEGVTFEDCNLKNTKINIQFDRVKNSPPKLYNTILDENMKIAVKTRVDMNTIEKNSDSLFCDRHFISVISQTFDPLFFVLKEEYRTEEDFQDMFQCTKEEYYKKMSYYVQKIINYLAKHNRSSCITFINKLLSSTPIDEVFLFLTQEQYLVTFKNINFTKEDLNILKQYDFTLINFEHCIFQMSYKEAAKKELDFPNVFRTYFKDCSLDSKNYQNCQIKRISNNKKSNSSFTCNTSVYVKLGNRCNASCSFCKNKKETINASDIEAISNTLTSPNLLKHLNQIYFGGGEPSLYLEEIVTILEKCSQYYKNNSPDISIFTNGSGDWEKIYRLLETNNKIKVILSRQAIEEKDNYKIMGINYSLDDTYLKKIIQEGKMTLSMTCSDQSLPEDYLKEYIKFGNFYSIKRFIIQSLEDKTKVIDREQAIEKAFCYCENYLSTERYSLSEIVSSSYFKLHLYKYFSDCSVAVKRYFSPDDLDKYWQYSNKHSFDLGIDSNGELYQDFQMIKKITQK